MKICLLIFVCSLFISVCNAQSGSLDKQFGNNKFFLASISSYGDIYGSTLQWDGKPLAVENAGNDFSIFGFTVDGLSSKSIQG